MITKKSLLWFSGLLTGLVILWDYVGNYKLCGGEVEVTCAHFLGNIELIFFLVIPIFIFSLITYWMRNEVFSIWLKFTYFWIPVSVIAIILTPETTGSLFEIDKGFISLVFSALFVILSILIIIISNLLNRRKS